MGKWRTWWWCVWNTTERAIWRRPRHGEGFRAVLMRVRQRREPFGEWEDVGRPESYQTVTWPQSMWDQLAEQGYVVAP